MNALVRDCEKRFTLVEFLVVAGIVSILASLLLPALLKARESAHAVYCINNLRQHYIGLLAYADDAKGYMPPTDTTVRFPGWYNGEKDVTRAHWDEFIALMGYLTIPLPLKKKDGTVMPDYYSSPVNQAELPLFTCPSWRNYTFAPNYLNEKGYGHTIDFCWYTYGVGMGEPRRISTFRSDAPMRTEGGRDANAIRYDTPYRVWGAVLFRHNGMANYLYVGGHIRANLPNQW